MISFRMHVVLDAFEVTFVGQEQSLFASWIVAHVVLVEKYDSHTGTTSTYLGFPTARSSRKSSHHFISVRVDPSIPKSTIDKINSFKA